MVKKFLVEPWQYTTKLDIIIGLLKNLPDDLLPAADLKNLLKKKKTTAEKSKLKHLLSI